MNNEIQPKYQEIQAKCSCGNTFKLSSTLAEDLTLDICSACHPFFTGQQKTIDSAGRIDRFYKKYGKRKAGAKKEAGDANS